MATAAFEIDVLLPGDLSPGDLAALQKCEGKMIFFATLRRRAALADVALASYYVNGAPPDTLSLMAAYRRRFPAIIQRVLPGKMTAAALGVAPLPPGAFIQNTGPFDLCNGDAVCVLPPILDLEDRLRLGSAGLELLFPLTVPQPQARELVARVVARAVEALGGNGQPRQPRGADVMYYNGRRYNVAPDLQHRDGANGVARTLVLNMIFAMNEGSLLLLALIPNLLTLGTQDGFVNAIIQMGSATREVGQLIHQQPPPRPQDGARRFCVYEALMAWIGTAARLGDVLGGRPLVRVCTFDGPSAVARGEKAPVIQTLL
ncbi:capsid triplex subunit 2 [Equid herpesvirus 6]|uniref:Capsid triplex subunit 2 n=1 Tax=Equid herpesvirus 6 TaxID=173566 RepID=A0A7S9YU23_9ALPH|nr:capsid triplex subunit 2 [Equid herpesvirus 6]QPI70154.1 capsid triplex subunit 2 [Equid herpesvirus 6]